MNLEHAIVWSSAGQRRPSNKSVGPLPVKDTSLGAKSDKSHDHPSTDALGQARNVAGGLNDGTQGYQAGDVPRSQQSDERGLPAEKATATLGGHVVPGSTENKWHRVYDPLVSVMAYPSPLPPYDRQSPGSPHSPGPKFTNRLPANHQADFASPISPTSPLVQVQTEQPMPRPVQYDEQPIAMARKRSHELLANRAPADTRLGDKHGPASGFTSGQDVLTAQTPLDTPGLSRPAIQRTCSDGSGTIQVAMSSSSGNENMSRRMTAPIEQGMFQHDEGDRHGEDSRVLPPTETSGQPNPSLPTVSCFWPSFKGGLVLTVLSYND